jgi:hypothetical protein
VGFGYYGGPYYPYYPYYAGYYYPYPGYYYPDGVATTIVDPAAMPAGTAMPVPPTAAPTPNWYYCDSAKGYYPYIANCAEGWRVVPAVPPGAPR